MVKYLILQVVAVAGVCGTTRAAVPGASELLARLAATMDRCQASYACTEEATRVSVIRRAPSPPYRLGEHTWHYWREYRWDGRRFRRRERAWGDYEKDPFPRSRSREQAEYHIAIDDLNRSIQYSVTLDKPSDGRVGYMAGPPDADRVRRSAANNTVLAPRIDTELRGCPNVAVRPEMEAINGVGCYVLDARTPDARYSVWIDPNHGYHIARWTRVTKMDRAVRSTVAFRRIDGTWVPVESVTEMNTFMPPAPVDRRIVERVKVTDFKIAPDHKALKSFEVNQEIPNGTRLFWAMPDHSVLTDYVWMDSGPVRKAKE